MDDDEIEDLFSFGGAAAGGPVNKLRLSGNQDDFGDSSDNSGIKDQSYHSGSELNSPHKSKDTIENKPNLAQPTPNEGISDDFFKVDDDDNDQEDNDGDSGILVDQENDKSDDTEEDFPIMISKKSEDVDAFSGHDTSTREILEWLDGDDSPSGAVAVPPSKSAGVLGSGDANRTNGTRSGVVKSSGTFDFETEIWGSTNESIVPVPSIDSSQASPEERIFLTPPAPSPTPNTLSNSMPLPDSLSLPTESATKYKTHLTPERPRNHSFQPAAIVSSRQTTNASRFELEEGADGFQEMDESAVIANMATPTSAKANSPSQSLLSDTPLPYSFSTLGEAVRSPDSSSSQVRQFLSRRSASSPRSPANSSWDEEDRKHLYVKLLCNKTFTEVQESSLAFSYTEWAKQQTLSSQFEEQDEIKDWLRSQAHLLSINMQFSDSKQQCKFEQDLVSLLDFYNQRQRKHLKIETPCDTNETTVDSSDSASFSYTVASLKYIATMLATLLHVLQCPATTSVVVHNLISTLVPILALTPDEQFEAGQKMAKYWYLLCLYNDPLVVMHLDQYLPGWYCPQMIYETSKVSSHKVEEDVDDTLPVKRYKNVESNGITPLSWFVAAFAGAPVSEGYGAAQTCRMEGGLGPKQMIKLWDILLTQTEARTASCLKFFLALSVLESHSHNIMELRDGNALQAYMEQEVFSSLNKPQSDEELANWMTDWIKQAQSVQEISPLSFVSSLSSSDDMVVESVLRERQRMTLLAIRQKMQQEALNHARLEKERIERAKMHVRLETKKKLKLYYDKFNPERNTDESLEKILSVYEGRFDILDEKLSQKYGIGFLTREEVRKYLEIQRGLRHAEEPQNSPLKMKRQFSAEAKRLIQTMNQGMGVNFPKKYTPNQHQSVEDIDDLLVQHIKEEERFSIQTQVALYINASEVLPHVCASKADTLGVPGSINAPPLRRRQNTSQIKYFLVDARPSASAKTHGRFPTAVHIPPKSLLDPDLIQKELEVVESLRGSVHIVVMVSCCQILTLFLFFFL